MPLWIPRTLAISLVITGFAMAGEPTVTKCVLNGIATPCIVYDPSHGDTRPIEPGGIDPKDWQFDEKDLPVDATSLHVELLNNTTYENAVRYATAEFYRHYRAEQARKLVDLVKGKMIAYVKAKYGSQLSPTEVIEAIVLEAGLPVIPVPAEAERDAESRLNELIRGQ